MWNSRAKLCCIIPGEEMTAGFTTGIEFYVFNVLGEPFKVDHSDTMVSISGFHTSSPRSFS